MPDYQFVTPQLAVGGAIYTIENMRALAVAGITHVVDLQQEFDDRAIVADTSIHVLWLPCSDDFLPKASDLFLRGVQFALNGLKHRNGRVLFHCAAGVHRAPMMLLATLRVLGIDAVRGQRMITDVRPQAEFPEVYLESIEAFLVEYFAANEPPPRAHV